LTGVRCSGFAHVLEFLSSPASPLSLLAAAKSTELFNILIPAYSERSKSYLPEYDRATELKNSNF